MKKYEVNTCLTFRNASENDTDLVEILDYPDCASYVGRTGGRQRLSLARDCHKGEAKVFLHELAHAIGLHHEHNRSDRDDYVAISFENINIHERHNFQKDESGQQYFGIPYSYLSLTHYGKRHNGADVIITKNTKYQNRIGRSKDLSFEELKLINSLYRCGSHCPKTLCPANGFVGKDCQCWCPSTQENSSIAPCYEYVQICGGFHYANETPQYISSPNYPKKYSPRISCTWNFLTKSGIGYILFQFLNFSTEDRYDRLVISDSTGIEKVISGSKTSFAVIAGHNVTIFFTSDDYIENYGFEIEFSQIAQDNIYGAASHSFQVPLSCVGVAVTHEGTLFLKTLHGTLSEYLHDGLLLDRWTPLKQSMQKVDVVQDVVALNNGKLAVGLHYSQLILLLRRNLPVDTYVSEWIEDPPLVKLQASPWRLSAFGDLLAVVQTKENAMNELLLDQQVQVWNVTAGTVQHVRRREYEIYSLALTSEAVITTSYRTLKVNDGDETVVVDAHSLSDDKLLWRYRVHRSNEFVEDVCTELTGHVLYAAVRTTDGRSGRVAAINMADGTELRDNIFDRASSLQPLALSSGRVQGHKHSSLVVLSIDPAFKQFKTVTVHRNQAI